MLYSIVLVLVLHVGLTKPNLFLGTGGFGFGCGSNSPAAQVPYSYVRLGPDTTPRFKKQYEQFQHFGGYSNQDHYLRAFSHMHLVGAGVQDMGIFGILPQKINKKTHKIPQDEQIVMYKSSEIAEPGYYKVDVENNVTVELTTTQRTGAHRYTFKDKGPYQVSIMTGYLLQKAAPRNSSTIRCGAKCLQGVVKVQGGFGRRFGGYYVHYHLEWVSKGQQTVQLYNDNRSEPNISSVSGNMTGATIQTKSQTFQIYIGISYVSIANAKQNLQIQTKNLTKSFSDLKKQSQQIWKKQLGRFQISAINQAYQTKIDTAIYRTLLTPTLFNDANRQYPSFKNDRSISIVPDDMKAVYTDMSLWDVHRTQLPWLLFQDLQRFNDIAKSIVLINRQGGYMPKWPFAMGWTGCMIGSHANTVLADWIVKQAFQKNITNTTQILQYMLRNANTNTVHDSRPLTQQYPTKGYVRYQNNQRSSCSQTLQLSFNDFGISQVAKLLNKTQIYDDFQNRSKFYKNLWNNQTKFFEPRFKNGSFVTISPKQRINIFSNYYTEGDAWHYRFQVPHDAAGLIDLFGGSKPFVKELYKFFKRSEYWPTFWLLNPYYWAGNEHDLFSVWLFSYANRSDLTQKFSRMIMDTQYGTGGNGLPGNDDYGTMSAWLVFASLGFYPLPSTNTYILGSPVVKSASIMRKNSDGTLRPLHIRVQGNNINNWKVRSVNLNGNPTKDFISHQDMAKSNSVVTFVMEL